MLGHVRDEVFEGGRQVVLQEPELDRVLSVLQNTQHHDSEERMGSLHAVGRLAHTPTAGNAHRGVPKQWRRH